MSGGNQHPFQEDSERAQLRLWKEASFPAEIVSLYRSSVIRGHDVPHGDGAAVIVFPGFLMPDLYLLEMRRWLKRIGYNSFFSGIGVNADCPNLLIEHRLNETVSRARRETGRKVHLIGHSLGGVIARAIAAQRPDDVASVITLASPFRGVRVHQVLLTASKAVRKRIFRKHNGAVPPDCYTGHCTCEFVQALRGGVPSSIPQTALYTRSDGLVDWRHCITEDPRIDVEIQATHIGLAFNPEVYRIIAHRLAQSS